MGMTNVHDYALRLLGTPLAKKLRYRCLLVQSADAGLLKDLGLEVAHVAKQNESPTVVVQSSECFDEHGALPCSDMIQMIEAKGAESSFVLIGPLTFLDYWSQSMRRAFWEYLAAFTRGPGVVLFDSLRDHDFEDSFRVLGKIPGTDIRYLKSRLAVTQDGLV
jgi:hypothetical protein